MANAANGRRSAYLIRLVIVYWKSDKLMIPKMLQSILTTIYRKVVIFNDVINAPERVKKKSQSFHRWASP